MRLPGSRRRRARAGSGLALSAMVVLLGAQEASRLPVEPVQRTAPTRALPFAPAEAVRHDWPQWGLDEAHSADNRFETILSRDNVSSLRRLFSVTLPEVADGAPALATAIATSSGFRDLLFLTTKAGRLVALDARTGATVWSTQPPPGPNYTTSSPAVDPDRRFVYGYGLDGFVHRYRIGDGVEVTGSGWPQPTTLKPIVEKGSSALSTAAASDGTTYLYVAHGGYPGDAGDYQGHLTTIRLSDGAQRVFNANCSDRTIHFVENGGGDGDCSAVQTALWSRPAVVYDARTDRIYAATGNGRFDASSGGHDWGDSVFALHPDGTGSGGGPLDSYTPTEFQRLQDSDADLGSAAPALLPVRDTRRFRALGLQGGKDGQLRLLDLENLSSQGGPGHVAGELQIFGVPQGGGFLTQPAVWVDPADGSAWVFVVNGSGVSALQLTFNFAADPALAVRWFQGPGGSSPIVANGVLYYAGSGRIAALDPKTGSVLWSDGGIGGIHWQSPIVANGILYVADESARVTAYAVNGAAP